MIRNPAPKNARSARAASERAPKLVENPKHSLLLHSSSSSQVLHEVVNTLHTLKLPFSKKFSKRNEGIHPFEDASSLEFFSQKNDCSFVVLASHSKKRPHNLIFARMFDHKVLDMFEFGVEQEVWRGLGSFPGEKARAGTRPMIAFAGDVWEREEAYRTLKNLFLDFFRGETVERVDVEGLQWVLSFAAKEGTNTIHMRGHMIRTKRSGQKLPRVDVEEMGPRLDLVIRRTQEASEEMLKEAMKKPKSAAPKSKKNIDTDVIGDKVGRIHTGKQDMSKLQVRKMKGLKRRGAEDLGGAGQEEEIGLDEKSSGKKRRL